MFYGKSTDSPSLVKIKNMNLFKSSSNWIHRSSSWKCNIKHRILEEVLNKYTNLNTIFPFWGRGKKIEEPTNVGKTIRNVNHAKIISE